MNNMLFRTRQQATVPAGNAIQVIFMCLLSVSVVYIDQSTPPGQMFGFRLFEMFTGLPKSWFAVMMLAAAWWLTTPRTPRGMLIGLLPHFLYIVMVCVGTVTGQLSIRGILPILYLSYGAAVIVKLTVNRFHSAKLATDYVFLHERSEKQKTQVARLQDMVNGLQHLIAENSTLKEEIRKQERHTRRLELLVDRLQQEANHAGDTGSGTGGNRVPGEDATGSGA